MLKIYLFGSPRLAQEEQAASLYRRRRSVALLTYLAQTQRPHSREKLVTLFWPEQEPTRARGNLRRDLFHIKKHLQEGTVTASRTQVGLNPEAELWVDTCYFQAQVDAVRAHNHEPGWLCPSCVEMLTAAVATYEEDFLAGFTLPDAPEFDEWCFFQAESLRQSLAEALQQLVAWHEQQQAYTLALPYAQRWLSLDVLNESVHRLLMRLYAHDGQQAAALRQFEKCQQLLADELGVEPEAETVALHEAIRMRQYPPAHGEAASRSSSLASDKPRLKANQSSLEPMPRFVARTEELGRLHDLLRRTVQGRCQAAFLVGDAGQGKTAMLQAFAWQARQAHPTLICASGSCNAYTGSGDPYLPFREILNFLTGDQHAATLSGPFSSAQLAQLLPLSVPALLQHGPDLIGTFLPAHQLYQRVAALLTEPLAWLEQLATAVARFEQSKQHSGSQVRQAALFEQYANVIQAISRQTPLILLLDDVQWIDAGSATLLHHLGRRLAGYPVMLVAAYRPAEVALGLAGESHPMAQIINEFQRTFGDVLLDLSEAAGETFITALLAQEPNALSDDFQATLYGQTNGHPLFTLELLRDMQERGDLVQNEQGQWIEQPNINWQRLPARVEGVIGERIRRLDGPLRDILQMASVSGELFSAEVVAAALNLNGRHVQTQLSRELDKKHQLVQALDIRQEGGLRLSRYRFRHILIQRYLYDSLDEIERVYQHEALGSALERLYGENTRAVSVELARHFETAVVPHKARHYLEQAGDQARQAIALEQARDYYRAALSYLEESEIETKAGLQQKLAETLWILGQVSEAYELFEDTLTLTTQMEDEKAMGVIHRHLGRMSWELHDRVQAIAHYERSHELLGAFPDSVELAWTLSSISQMYIQGMEYEKAIAWGERALDLANKLGADTVRAHAFANMGMSYRQKDAKQAVALLYESARLAKEAGLPHHVGQVYYYLISLLFEQDRNEEAMVVIEEAYSYAERTQTEVFLLGAAFFRMSLAWYLGKWRLSLAQLAQIKTWLAEREAVALNPIMIGKFAATSANDCGLPQEALAELAVIETLVLGLDEPASSLGFYRQMMRAHALLGNTDKVGELIEMMLEISERPSLTLAHTSWCYTLIDWLATREDASSLEKAKRLLDSINSASIDSPELPVDYYEGLGQIALWEQKGAQAVAALAQVVAARKAGGYKYGLMRAQFNYGKALSQIGQQDKAQAAYEEAAQIAAALAEELDDPQRKAGFLQTPLLQAVRQMTESAL